MVISPVVMVSPNPARSAKWIVHQQRTPEQEPLWHQAPGAAIGTGWTVVTQTEEMTRLNEQRLDRRIAKLAPFTGIAPVLDADVGVTWALAACVVRISE